MHLRGPGDHRRGPVAAGAPAGGRRGSGGGAPGPPRPRPRRRGNPGRRRRAAPGPHARHDHQLRVKVGDKVNTGDLVCVLEAMKMQNSLPAPASGTIKAINFEPGATVAKDAIILVIGK